MYHRAFSTSLRLVSTGSIFTLKLPAMSPLTLKPKLVFQPGTFQIKLGAEKLKELYQATEIFFCNKEEAQEILSTTEQDVPTLIRKMRELGPTMPVITDGPHGAYVVDGDDQAWHMPMYPDPAPPVDRTGAGDSFSSAPSPPPLPSVSLQLKPSPGVQSTQ
jgi:sugar/nucleoside kinase (ribokinase family)